MNYYEMLGLPHMDVSIAEIKKAFKELVKRHHPDKNPEDAEGAHERMIAINEAHDVLSNSTKRMKYDDGLRAYISDKREREEASNRTQSFAQKPDDILVNAGQVVLGVIGLIMILLFLSVAMDTNEDDDD